MVRLRRKLGAELRRSWPLLAAGFCVGALAGLSKLAPWPRPAHWIAIGAFEPTLLPDQEILEPAAQPLAPLFTIVASLPQKCPTSSSDADASKKDASLFLELPLDLSPAFFPILTPFSRSLPSWSPAGQYLPDQPLPSSIAKTCQMDSCFDMRRCLASRGHPSKMPLVYVYNTTVIGDWMLKEMLDWLRTRPYVTTDPNKACLFVHDLPLQCAGNACFSGSPKGYADKMLREKLQYWNHGRNHILYVECDYSAQRWAKLIGLETSDRAILAHTNFYPGESRTGFDVTIPLEARSLDLEWSTYSPKPAAERKYLASFRGSRYATCGEPIRNALRWLDSEEVSVRLKCAVDHVDMLCKQDEAKWNSGPSYAEMLTNSKFGIVARGCGLHSYRWVEAGEAPDLPCTFCDSC